MMNLQNFDLVNSPTTRKTLSFLLALLTAGVIGYSFYLSLTLYSYFIIGRDEANFLLRSSMAIFAADHFLDATRELFQTHGQHILVGMQLANLLSFLLLDTLDFQFINLIGLLYLVIPTGLLCWRLSCRQIGNRVLCFFLAAAAAFPLALSPGHISCAINTACTGNHYLGLGLSIVALYLFVPDHFTQPHSLLRLIGAQACMWLAVLSSPASLVLIPLLFWVIVFLPSAKKTLLILHGISSSILLLAYFHIADPADFSYTRQLSWAESLNLLLMYVLLFLNVLGSVFFWPQQTPSAFVSIGLGIIMTAMGLWQIKRIFFHSKPTADRLFFGSGFLLLLGMIALISLGRVGTFGSPRYTVYGCFALIFLLFSLGAARPPNKMLSVIVISCLCLLYYPVQLALNEEYIQRIQDSITTCNARWEREGKACGVMMKHDDATALLLEAEQQGILRLPR